MYDSDAVLDGVAHELRVGRNKRPLPTEPPSYARFGKCSCQFTLARWIIGSRRGSRKSVSHSGAGCTPPRVCLYDVGHASYPAIEDKVRTPCYAFVQSMRATTRDNIFNRTFHPLPPPPPLQITQYRPCMVKFWVRRNCFYNTPFHLNKWVLRIR